MVHYVGDATDVIIADVRYSPTCLSYCDVRDLANDAN
jgi:hypothetical protein